MKDENKSEKTTVYVQSVKDIENAVKAIFKPMKYKYVTITSLSNSLANIVANFSDVVEKQINIDSAKLCREVASSLLGIAWKKKKVKTMTNFEEALTSVCDGYIGHELGWKDYIRTNAKALLNIAKEEIKK